MAEIFSKTLNANSTANSNKFTTVMKFAVGTLESSSGSVPYDLTRITLTPATSGSNFILDHVFIGHAAGAGDAYDFDGNQVEVTFGGGAGVTLITGGANQVSDAISFPLDTSKVVLIAFEWTSTANKSARNNTSSTNITFYFLQNVTEAGTTNKTSGYGSVSNRLDFVSKIEAFDSGGSSSTVLEQDSSSNEQASSSNAAESDARQEEQDSSSDFLATYTWNPFDKTSNVSLTNTNHTASGAATVGGIRAIHSRDSGKRYFELFVPAVTQNSQFNVFGMATAAYGLSSDLAYLGNEEFSGVVLGIYGGGGHFTMSNNTLRFAVDFFRRQISYALNGGNFSPPLRFKAGSWFPAVAFKNTGVAISATINMGDSIFSYPIPSGFVAWNDQQEAGSDGQNLFNSIIVAAGNPSGASSQTIMHTTNAVDWTLSTTPVDGDLDGISYAALTWSPELNLFVAIASSTEVDSTDKQILTSPDGVTWTLRNCPEQNQWQGVTWSPELSLFVATAIDGTHRVMTSPDGITWTARTAAAAAEYDRVVWSSFHQRFVAYGSDTMYSSDGITWTAGTRNGTTTADCLSVNDDGRFVVLGFGGIGDNFGYSDDGITWTNGGATSHQGWKDICWSPDLGIFLAVSQTAWATSSDGTVWTAHTFPGTEDIRGVCWSRMLQSFIAVGGANSYVLTSPDGAVGSWSTQSVPANHIWQSVIEGILYNETLSSEIESAIMSDIRASSDKEDHDRASSDAKGAGASSSDAVLSDEIQSGKDASDKARQDAASSSDKFFEDQASSSNAEAASSDKFFEDQASSSDRPANEQASSEFQSDQTNAPAPPIQVVVTVGV